MRHPDLAKRRVILYRDFSTVYMVRKEISIVNSKAQNCIVVLDKEKIVGPNKETN